MEKKRKEEFIVDNGVNGLVDLPGLGIQISRGAYDVDLCELTKKSVSELLSHPQVRYAIKRGWIIPKEKRNGKRIVFKNWDSIDIEGMLREVDNYLAGGKEVPKGLIPKYVKPPKPVIEKATAENAPKESSAAVYTEEQIDAMEYGDLLSVVAEFGIKVDSNEKEAVIKAVKNFFGYGKKENKEAVKKIKKEEKEEKEEKEDKAVVEKEKSETKSKSTTKKKGTSKKKKSEE